MSHFTSLIYSFIKSNCNQKPSYTVFNTLVRYFAKEFRIKTTRNDYRRLNQCVYWLDQNSERIFDYILEKGGHIVIPASKGMKEDIILKNVSDFRMQIFESRLKSMKITHKEYTHKDTHKDTHKAYTHETAIEPEYDESNFLFDFPLNE